MLLGKIQLERDNPNTQKVLRRGKNNREPMILEGFPGGSDGKAPPAKWETWVFDPWDGKIPWKREWQWTPVYLPGEVHGQRSLVGYSPWGCTKSDTTSLSFFLCFWNGSVKRSLNNINHDVVYRMEWREKRASRERGMSSVILL